MYGRSHEKSASAKAKAAAKTTSAKPAKGRGKGQEGSIQGSRRSKKDTYGHQTYVRDFVDPCQSKIS